MSVWPPDAGGTVLQSIQEGLKVLQMGELKAGNGLDWRPKKEKKRISHPRRFLDGEDTRCPDCRAVTRDPTILDLIECTYEEEEEEEPEPIRRTPAEGTVTVNTLTSKLQVYIDGAWKDVDITSVSGRTPLSP